MSIAYFYWWYRIRKTIRNYCWQSRIRFDGAETSASRRLDAAAGQMTIMIEAFFTSRSSVHLRQYKTWWAVVIVKFLPFPSFSTIIYCFTATPYPPLDLHSFCSLLKEPVRLVLSPPTTLMALWTVDLHYSMMQNGWWSINFSMLQVSLVFLSILLKLRI